LLGQEVHIRTQSRSSANWLCVKALERRRLRFHVRQLSNSRLLPNREVLVSRQELSMPPTIRYEQAKNFGLFMLTAVLNGRGDEIIDLVRVNLLR